MGIPLVDNDRMHRRSFVTGSATTLALAACGNGAAGERSEQPDDVSGETKLLGRGIHLLKLGPRGNHYTNDGNMTPGVIQSLTDPGLGQFSVITLRGADNQATIIRGIDSTNATVGQHYLFYNHMKEPDDNGDDLKDCGQVVFNHEDPDAVSPSDQIICPQALPFKCPVFGVVELSYESDCRWHIVEGSGGFFHTCTAQNYRVYPNFLAPPIGPGIVNNWNPTAQSTYDGGLNFLAGGDGAAENYTLFRIPTDRAGAYLTGFAPNAGKQADLATLGGVKIFYNQGPGTLTLAHLHSDSEPAHQFDCPNGIDLPLGPGETAFICSMMGDPVPLSQWAVIGLAKYNNNNFASASVSGLLTSAQLVLGPSNGRYPEVGTLPPASAGIIHDLDVGDAAYQIRLVSHPSGSLIGGLVSALDGIPPRGERHLIVNAGNGPIALVNGDDESLVNNRFEMPATIIGAPPVIIPSLGAVEIFKDDTDSWKPIAAAAAPPISITDETLLAASGNVDDWSPCDVMTRWPFLFATWIRFVPGAGLTLRTMNPALYDGQTFRITNYNATITIANQQSTGMTGVGIICPGLTPFTLGPFVTVNLIFDGRNNIYVLA